MLLPLEMKRLDGSAAVEVGSSPAECVTLLAAVQGYPAWYPEVVRRVEVVESDRAGQATRARATLHVAHGPLVRDFNLLLAIATKPAGTITLARVPHDPAD